MSYGSARAAARAPPSFRHSYLCSRLVQKTATETSDQATSPTLAHVIIMQFDPEVLAEFNGTAPLQDRGLGHDRVLGLHEGGTQLGVYLVFLLLLLRLLLAAAKE